MNDSQQIPVTINVEHFQTKKVESFPKAIFHMDR